MSQIKEKRKEKEKKRQNNNKVSGLLPSRNYNAMKKAPQLTWKSPSC